MGWLLYCNTNSLRKHSSSVPCSVLLSNNYVIIKASGRNIMASINLGKRSVYNFPSDFSLKVFLCSLAKRSPQNASNLWQDVVIYHPKIFATQSLIILLQLTKLCISLLRWSSINSENYFAEVLNKDLDF